jgi:hypothetical protein
MLSYGHSDCVSFTFLDGKELRTYISSQYSTNMVLLSLLLGIQINVFFNSSPEMDDLRRVLQSKNILISTEENINSLQHGDSIFRSLQFWIGFLLLMNICMTIMGILATFTTWSMISAISDRNAHCLLRSSMGQYVTTLSPRLVVSSVYLFLSWFLLFVIDIVAMSNPLLWALLLWVAFMFFSIVIPLSAFGRLVLHTGAMAQKPVLSEDLEKELLPNGLHASLVIRAHHRQRRNMSVTNQYRRNQQSHQQQQEQQHFVNHDAEERPASRSETATNSNGAPRRGMHRFVGSNGTMFAPEEVTALENDSMVYTEAERSSSMGVMSDYFNAANAQQTPQEQPLRVNETHQAAVDFQTVPTFPSHRQINHRRLQTSETAIDLPPAAILNMSLTGKEFSELINNAMDTSSLGGGGEVPDLRDSGRMQNVEDRHPDMVSKRVDLQRVESPSLLPKIHGQHPTPPSLQALIRDGVPPPYPITQSSNNVTAKNATNYQQHHRRASSSRFLLNEWAEESSIRDLYGAAPPAEIPREISLPVQDEPPQQRSPSSSWSPRRMWNRPRNENSTWLVSPFALEANNRHGHANEVATSSDGNDNLIQPLLPTLDGGDTTTDNDEERGGSQRGEYFLPPTERLKTPPSSNSSKTHSRRKNSE